MTLAPLIALCAACSPQAPARILIFSKTAAFRHDCIETGVKALTEVAEGAGMEVVSTEDAAIFGDRGLGRFDALVFLCTTGDVLNETQQAGFEALLEAGRGYVGIHAAADTEYDWPFYGKVVGAYFKRHPAIQKAQVKIEKPKDPICAGLPKIWERTDEWYDYRANPRKDVSVLASMVTSSYENSEMKDDHPIMWKHEVGKARCFYTGFGHTKETYADPLFRKMILAAIKWAAKKS